MEQKHHGSGFMNGFILGAIVGAAIVFFLFTEKGRKLLRTITEEGLDGASELHDLLAEDMDEEEYESTREPVQSVETGEPADASHHSSKKRFFRGVKK